MSTSIPASKKKRGRPAIGKGTQVVVRLQREPLDHLDAWIDRQPEPRPTRPEAIRRILEKAMAAEYATSHQSDASLERQISKAEAAIADMPEYDAPSPEAGMAIMDKAVAENDLVRLKNKRTRRQSASRKTTKPKA